MQYPKLLGLLAIAILHIDLTLNIIERVSNIALTLTFTLRLIINYVQNMCEIPRISRHLLTSR